MLITAIDYNPDDFNINIHMSWIPSFIADLIIKIFKSKILHSIIPKIVDSVNKQSEQVINEVVDKYYPL